MEIIGEGLKKNHTILGLHVKGNQAELDANGFIQPISDFAFYTKVQLMQRIKPKLEANKTKIQSQIARNLSLGENCWICEGWSEVTFKYSPGISDDTIDLDNGEFHEPHIPINIHLDCDNFLADLLQPKDLVEA